jgi:translocator assembly and maintenance protein 41
MSRSLKYGSGRRRGSRLTVQEVKYGIIQTKSLIHDLRTWETLYISGRLQKPHLPLLPPPISSTSSIKEGGLEEALQTNLRQSLSLALILLPDRFTEYQLWEKIAGISYAGDPRMSVPGAENPEKVRNIVRGEGALEGFRAMYGDLLEPTVHWEGEGEKGGERISWKGQGEDMMVVSPYLFSLSSSTWTRSSG